MSKMNKQLYQDDEFLKEDFSVKSIAGLEFESCLFKDCNLADVDLSGRNFIDCTFDNCDLSLIKLKNSGIRDVAFKRCKIIGVDFSPCNDFLFSFSFDSCYLDYCIFFQKKIKTTKFNDCQIKETDFTEADLTDSRLTNCDLTGSIFDRSNLEKVDFRDSRNYSIDPTKNRIKKAKFSIPEVIGLLDQYDIKID